MNNTEPTIAEPPVVNPFTDRLPPEPKPKKASILSQVTVRKRKRPVMALLYGQPGIGKSTWSAGSPKPIFISTERGIDQLNAARLPQPRDFKALYDQVYALQTEEHDYETVVLDTIDGAEQLIFQRVMTEGNVTTLESYAGGYGKCYVRAKELWLGLLNMLSEMSERMNIILISHSMIKTIADPSLSAPYDVHQIRLQEKSAAIVYQAVDTVLFAQLDTTIQKDSPKARKGRGIVSGDRLLWTEPGTGYIAKNRFGLPPQLPFEWAALENGINDFYAG
jgi:AAA domain